MLAAFALAIFSAPHGGQAAIVHDESVDGMLSNDNLTPTPLTFTIGENTVLGTIEDADGVGNVDVFWFNVPTGVQWTGLVVEDYQSSDNLAFVALNDDSFFPYNTFELQLVQDAVLSEDAFLGGTTFGAGDVGSDILARAGNVSGRRFDPPLSSGNYTIYVQQTGAISDYGLTVQLTAIPEPGVGGALLLGSCVVGMRRRRRP